MAIQLVYKVYGLSQEFSNEQEAQIAEVIQDTDGLYIEAYKIPKLTAAITAKYFLVPILPTFTLQEVEPATGEVRQEQME